MTRKNNRPLVPPYTLGTLLLSVMVVFLAAPTMMPKASVGAGTGAPVEQRGEVDAEVETEDTVSAAEKSQAEKSQAEKIPAKEVEEPQPEVRWSDYPNVCETFTVLEGDKRVKNKKGKLVYPIRYRRNRFDRKRSHQKRTRQLIRAVAREMGADEAGQYLVEMVAHHESSWNPEAIHVLNRDLKANLEAWERHSYDPGREVALMEELRETSAKSKRFWTIKSQLADLRLYKGNPFWDAQLEYVHKIPERTLHGETTEAVEFTERRSVWAFGYGLFGMNAVLFTHVWDTEAPPWILCADEGIVATVTAIWALRGHQSECEHLSGTTPEKYGTEGGSAYGVVRRFAKGHCSDKTLGPAWRRLMAQYRPHVDWDQKPDLGHKYPRYKMRKRKGKWVYVYEKEIDPETGEAKRNPKTGRIVYKRDSRGRKVRIPTDRRAILAHMHKRIEAKGLFRPAPLERKKPDSKPVVVAMTSAADAAP